MDNIKFFFWETCWQQFHGEGGCLVLKQWGAHFGPCRDPICGWSHEGDSGYPWLFCFVLLCCCCCSSSSSSRSLLTMPNDWLNLSIFMRGLGDGICRFPCKLLLLLVHGFETIWFSLMINVKLGKLCEKDVLLEWDDANVILMFVLWVGITPCYLYDGDAYYISYYIISSYNICIIKKSRIVHSSHPMCAWQNTCWSGTLTSMLYVKKHDSRRPGFVFGFPAIQLETFGFRVSAWGKNDFPFQFLLH